MVVCARPVSGHGTPPRIGVESRTAPGRCGQRSDACHDASGLASRVCRRDTTRRRSRVPVHRDRPRRPYTRGASKRARVSRAARRPGCRGGPPLAPARARGLDACGTRTTIGERRLKRPSLPLSSTPKNHRCRVAHIRGTAAQCGGARPWRPGDVNDNRLLMPLLKAHDVAMLLLTRIQYLAGRTAPTCALELIPQEKLYGAKRSPMILFGRPRSELQ